MFYQGAGFKTDVRTVHACGEFQGKPRLILTPNVVAKYTALLNALPNREWIGYLQGAPIKDGGFRVYDFVVPPQVASTGTCEADKNATRPENCIGTIHSHHDMGAFFSSTDQEHLIENYLVNIVVSHKGLDARIRTKASCGHLYACPPIVSVEPEKPLDNWVSESIKQLREPPPIRNDYPYYAGRQYDYGYDFPPYDRKDTKEKKSNRKERCLICNKSYPIDEMEFIYDRTTNKIDHYCNHCLTKDS